MGHNICLFNGKIVYLHQKKENDGQILLSFYGGPVAALPRTDAIRLLPAGAVCRDGGLCGDGMELL